MIEESDRPLVTFALFAFNQEKYIREAIEGAFAQTYEPLEIILSDDCSTDRTFEIMQEMAASYSGAHKISINKNTNNIGLINHLNKVLLMANGELIVLAAGDDISFPNRASTLVSKYIKNGKPLLLHSRALQIDSNGQLNGHESPPLSLNLNMNLEEAAVASSIYLGASGAWSRELLDIYGEITFQDAYEDMVAGFRAILENRILYVDSHLLYYRVGDGISTAVPRRAIEYFNRRIKTTKVFVGVLRQRISDLSRSGYSKPLAKKKMIDLLYKYECLHALYFNRKLLLCYFVTRPVQCIKMTISELMFLIKVFCRHS